MLTVTRSSKFGTSLDLEKNEAGSIETFVVDAVACGNTPPVLVFSTRLVLLFEFSWYNNKEQLGVYGHEICSRLPCTSGIRYSCTRSMFRTKSQTPAAELLRKSNPTILNGVYNNVC